MIAERSRRQKQSPRRTAAKLEQRVAELRRRIHETQYLTDPFEAPAWRRQWVQPLA